MGAVLGWLAGRHGVDLADGARVQFTSRGSNRYAKGAAVDVATVSGHRDVSQTACPGDAAYALVTDGTFRRLARGGAPITAPPATAPPTTRAAAPTTTAATSTTVAAATTTSTVPASSTSSSTSTVPTGIAAPLVRDDDTGGSSGLAQAAAGAGVLALVAAGLIAVRARRQP